MIAFDLKCAKGHVFEAWFASSQGYERDVKAKRVECPLCGSTKIEKALMAPNVSTGKRGAQPMPAPPDAPTDPNMEKRAELLKKIRELQTTIEREFDHVGDRFADEARKIHYGETEKRSIYGSATPEESKELTDEGIEFGQMPWLPRHDA